MRSPAALCSGKDEFVEMISRLTRDQKAETSGTEYAKDHNWNRIFAKFMRILNPEQATHKHQRHEAL